MIESRWDSPRTTSLVRLGCNEMKSSALMLNPIIILSFGAIAIGILHLMSGWQTLNGSLHVGLGILGTFVYNALAAQRNQIGELQKKMDQIKA
jgi:hypothetical protein